MPRRALAATALVIALGVSALAPATADDSPQTLPSGIGAALPRVDVPQARHTRPLVKGSAHIPQTVPWGKGTQDVPGTSVGSLGLEEFLTRTSTRAFVVLHQGKLVHEWYADGIDRDTKLASW